MLKIGVCQAHDLLAMRVKCILRLHVNATCLQVFRQGVWIHLVYHVSAAERSSYLAAQHLGIAARDIDLVFLVCQPSCKLLPSIHQLYLVQEEDGTTVVHLLIASLDQIEVAQLQGVYAVVLEVEIQDFLSLVSLRYQLGDALKHQVGLASMSQPDKHIVLPLHERYVTGDQLDLSHISLILGYEDFYQIFCHTSLPLK